MPMEKSELMDRSIQRLADRAKLLPQVTIGDWISRDFLINEFKKAKEEEKEEDGYGKTAVHEWLTKEVWPHPTGQSCLYVIEADSRETALAICKAFPPHQIARDREYARCRVNPRPSRDEELGTVLYVGSSQKSVKQRLKQHLWKAADGTYAMHFSRRCGDIKASEGAYLKVSVCPVTDPTGQGLIQDIEDALWDVKQPLFGKRGGR